MKGLRKRRVIIIACTIVATLVVTLVVLRIFGLIGIYSIPTASMAPTIEKGDCIFTEGITYHFRKPERGAFVVFSWDDIDPLHPDAIYVKRVIGLPGETLHFSEGKLYVNDKPVAITNKAGEINFTETLEFSNLADGKSVTVPDGHYFVLGDNLANSADSRLWGPIPAGSIKGRVAFRFWPLRDFGALK